MPCASPGMKHKSWLPGLYSSVSIDGVSMTSKLALMPALKSLQNPVYTHRTDTTCSITDLAGMRRRCPEHTYICTTYRLKSQGDEMGSISRIQSSAILMLSLLKINDGSVRPVEAMQGAPVEFV